MADIRWISDTTGAWDTGSNWQGGVKPGASDRAIFDGGHVGSVTQPVGTESVDSVYVAPAYTGQRGTQANPLTVNCSDRLLDLGGGNGYWTSTVDSAILGPVSRAADALNVTLTASGAKQFVAVVRGRVNLIGGSINWLIVTSDAAGNQPIVDHDSGCTLGGPVSLLAGNTTLEGAPSSDPIFVDRGAVLTLEDVSSIANMLKVNGGQVRASGQTAISIDELRVTDSGVVDLSSIKQSITIASLLHASRGSIVDLDNGRPPVVSAAVLIAESNAVIRAAGTLTIDRFP